SLAVFNATYRHQVALGALLTTGADVAVTEPPGARPAALDAMSLARIRGVRHVEALEHRFVYVGADLQDLYGVDPRTIIRATHLQDAYFAGGGARPLMATLARQPDAALVSAETVRDFQLHTGDLLRLRVRDPRTGGQRIAEFRYAGVVKEFPTAPSDSFVVANAAYVAARTGDSSRDTFLVNTGGVHRRAVAARVKKLVGTTATVTDLDTSRRIVGSSLTAVDLAGLTKVELAFALVLAAASAGLVLALGLSERRRGFAITTALGARPRQLGAFV